MAQPTPPLPTTSARAPAGSKPLRLRPRTNPSPSNCSPASRPSGRRLTALHAPATFTAGEASSSISTTLTLCGMVISAPRMFSSANNPRRTCAKDSALHAMGTTTALTPTDAKYGL